jgi:hypothetical protein
MNEELLASLTSGINDPSIVSAVAARYRREFEHPPCSALELMLRRNVPPGAARQLLFTPSADEVGIGLYPHLILSAPLGSAPEHPLRRLQPAFLSLLLLVHLRSWGHAAAFVREGGLGALAELLLDPNYLVRGQALDCFLQITSHPAYDWFAPPAQASDDQALHRGVLGLAQPVAGSSSGAAAVPFLSSLLKNWDCPAPGISFSALQLLAWWLSWVRAIHCSPKHPLQVSGALLESLRAWAERPVGGAQGVDGEEGAGGPSKLDMGGGTSASLPPKAHSTAEEGALARKVYEDFSQFAIQEEEPQGGGSTSASARGGGGGGIGGSGGSAPALPAAAAAPVPTVKGITGVFAQKRKPAPGADPASLLTEDGCASGEAAATSPTSAAHDRVTVCKEEGNAHFRGERWGEACKLYGEGIALVEKQQAQAQELGGTLIALLSNRALARLRGAGYGGGLYPLPAILALLKDTAPAQQLREVMQGGLQGQSPEASPLSKLLYSVPPATRAALVGLFGCLSDCERVIALSPAHRKALLRRAQAALCLGDSSVALASARSALIACTREDGGGEKEAVSSCRSFLNYAIAFYGSGEGMLEEGAPAALAASESASPYAAGTAHASFLTTGSGMDAEDESEDSILSALMCRAEFGGGAGAVHTVLFQRGGAGSRTEARGVAEEEEEEEKEVEAEEGSGAQLVDDVLSMCLGEKKPLPPPSGASGGAQEPPSAQQKRPVSVDDVLAGRVKSSASAKPAKKTFSLPLF